MVFRMIFSPGRNFPGPDLLSTSQQHGFDHRHTDFIYSFYSEIIFTMSPRSRLAISGTLRRKIF